MSECQLWTGGFNRAGYGYTSRKHPLGRVLAHRAAYIEANGPIPDGMIVRHTCDNPPCCNPEHLVLGSHADNTKDKVSRGRQTKGEEVHLAKLTEESVLFILRSTERSRVLEKVFGVSQGTISRIRNRKIWKHLEV